ncbi:MAG: hemerythrin domain-containing protein, partial [Candidatus Dormibacteraeota bacterium]|nr:hemerythrin domain-containing protein [Candidatus Dormibacteraeota bacterium]
MDVQDPLRQLPRGSDGRYAEAIATAVSAAGRGGERLAAAAADLLERLTTELIPGLEAEEQVLFPLLARRPQGGASAERLRDQHRQIRTLTEVLAASMYRLQEKAGPAGWLRGPLTRL